ncbi:MAG: hypothetical protein IJ594_06140 [Oscillospiraceae bacterium]|nr:hypothetical protein [Oscillospiraceae bacterium]
MKVFKRIITILFSLAYIVFLVLCAFSPFMQARGETSAASSSGGPSLPAFSIGTPKVEFAAGSFPEDAEELTLALQAGETALLDRFAALKSADLRGSADLEEVLAWAEAHPDVAVRYSVTLPNGVVLDDDATAADLSGLTADQAEATLALLQHVPGLKDFDLGSGDKLASFTGAQIAALREAFPEAAITGALTLLGEEIDPAVETLDLRSLRHDDVSDATATLALLANVKTISLGSAADTDLTWEDIGLIESACPEAKVDYAFSLWGKDLNLSDEMLDFNHITMNDQGAAVREIMPYMTGCKVLDMDFCNVSNENMAVIRDENPDVDVVWRIWFGSDYSVRTNVTSILASKPSKGGTLYDSVGDQLKYCTKVRYLDLGHNSEIYDFNFVRSMPDLEIVVISMTGISDLSPFASCTHLKYMEAGNCRLSDLSPLAECKELRHLNVGTNEGVHDISPLYDLELRRLWLGVGDPVPAEQVAEMRRLHPKCEVNTTVPTGKEQGAAKTEGYVMEYWKCYQQYLAADWQYYSNTGVFPAQRPLGWWKVVFKAFQYNLQDQAYAFSWNDPKYNPHDPDVAPVNTRVLDTSFLDEDFEIPETIIPDKLDDPPGEILYESAY